MRLPETITFVRHAESLSNEAVRAYFEDGDESLMQSMRQIPDREIGLSEPGIEQATAASKVIFDVLGIERFDVLYTSPLRRADETARILIPDGNWVQSEFLSERSWGEISLMHPDEHKRLHPENFKEKDAYHFTWTPIGGESIEQTAHEKSLPFRTNTRHLPRTSKSVLAVTHGDWMWASEFSYEGLDEKEWTERYLDRNRAKKNLYSTTYSRKHPKTNEFTDDYTWVRRVHLLDPSNDSGWQNIPLTQLPPEILEA